MLKIILTDEEHIPEWLYPGSWDDLQTDHRDQVTSDAVSRDDLALLWSIVRPDFEGDPLLEQTFEDVGIPHDAPASVDRINQELISALARIPRHERWRTAQNWLVAVASGRRPNQRRLAAAKVLIGDLCALADRADEALMLVVLPPGF